MNKRKKTINKKEDSSSSLKNESKIIRHLGIILDGNRRWAKQRGLNPLFGHRRGFSNIKKIVKVVFKKGIKVLTVYAFSTENWKRDKTELKYLMKLFKVFLKKEIRGLLKQDIKINFWGRLSDFSKEMQAEIKDIEKKSKNGSGGVLNICFSYGGRDELVRAVKKIVRKRVMEDDITADLISNNLDSRGLPDPDLIIRTSGEQRLSGFLTWQSIYSELYFTKKYWPEFTEVDLDKALNNYSLRQRRFGRA